MAQTVKEVDDVVVYFTQKELAQRWRVSEATIKKIRDEGGIPYFLPPNSTRVLYPRHEVVEIEHNPINYTRKEVLLTKTHIKSKMKKPVVSSKSQKKWEI